MLMAASLRPLQPTKDGRPPWELRIAGGWDATPRVEAAGVLLEGGVDAQGGRQHQAAQRLLEGRWISMT